MDTGVESGNHLGFINNFTTRISEARPHVLWFLRDIFGFPKLSKNFSEIAENHGK
jgi:hypothetical protein